MSEFLCLLVLQGVICVFVVFVWRHLTKSINELKAEISHTHDKIFHIVQTTDSIDGRLSKITEAFK